MDAIKTFSVTLGETTTLRATRGEMLQKMKSDFGLTVVKRGFTTWRLLAGGQTVGRIDEVEA
jgi:hypothetical protein